MEEMMTIHTGFPIEALQFFKDIEKNNNKAWFEAHKEEYARSVQQPAQEFVMMLGARLQELSPGISFDLSLSGSGSIMRIYRDTRFSPDKTPYKTYLGMRLWEGPGYKDAFSGLFIWLDYNGAGIHLGQHMFSKEYLTAYRDAVADPEQGAALETALETAARHAKIGGEQYVRVPQGYPPEHPRADLLKYKALYATSERISPDTVTGPDFLPCCVSYFEDLLPLHRWMVDVGKTIG
jgi:uncharacterized protein (TIGR02453 family)